VIPVHFDPDFKFRFLNSFLVVTVLAIITEAIRCKLERKVQKRNKELDFALSEIKKRERAINESEFTFKELIDRSNEGIVIVQNKIIKYINQSLSQMGGYTIDELIDSQFTNYIADDKVKEVFANYILRLANVKVPKAYNSILIGKDGTRIPVEIRGGRIPFKGNMADLVFIRKLDVYYESANFVPEVITMPRKKHT
jgi:PAS domain S-box-containing protein